MYMGGRGKQKEYALYACKNAENYGWSLSIYFCVEIVCKCFVTETSPTTSDENTNEIALGTLLAISVVGLLFSLTVNVIVCIRLHRRKTRLCIVSIYICIKMKSMYV